MIFMKNVTTVPGIDKENPMKFPSYSVSIEEFWKMQREREDSLLTPDQLQEMIQEGDASVVCLNPNAQQDKRVYMYVDQSEEACELAHIQFYGKDNQLLFTYPWNGGYEGGRYCEATGKYGSVMLESTDRFTFFGGRKETYCVQVTATESGRIAISDLSRKSRVPLVDGVEWSAEVHEYNDRFERYVPTHFRQGAVFFENYSNQDELSEIKQISASNGHGKNVYQSNVQDFVGTAIAGDKYLEFVQHNSYVM